MSTALREQKTNMPQNLLIFGFGYTAHFLAEKLRETQFTVTATTRDNNTVGFNSNLNCELIDFTEKNIEQTLATTTHILISTPPSEDVGDPVIANFSHLLKKYMKNIQWIGYLSSTSVYGDHQGRWVDESSPAITPGILGNARLSAEHEWISLTQAYQVPLTIFRLAGIYGPKRNILARLMAGKQDTIFKENHFFSRIHVEDIASAIIAAMQNITKGVTIYNIADDEPAPSYIVDEYAAFLLNRPALTRIAYETAILSPMAKEFYSHNKRVSNAKLKKELHIQLIYPSYKEGLTHLLHQENYLCS